MFFKDPDHEMRVYALNGSVLHFTIGEVYELYRSWQAWALFLVGFFFMSTGHPVTLPQYDSFGLRMAFWVVALLFYILASDLNARMISTIWGRLFGGPIPMFFMSVPLVLASTYVASVTLTLTFEPGRDVMTVVSWQMNVRDILVAHCFEMVALLWLIPAQRARAERAEQGGEIALAGRSFAVSEISRIKAAEHYLHIYNGKDVEIIRERMSTFLKQVTPHDGVQSHRSHWVARNCVISIGNDHLQLNCGAVVPVARGRQKAVREWFQACKDIGETTRLPFERA